MKAISLDPGTTSLRLAERPEPAVTAPDEVKLKVLSVGICGTDREEAAGGRADPPEGSHDLVLGHEMFGQVAETGGSVTDVKKGDFCVLTVRRGCGRCPACNTDRPDMCNTGQYKERGIKRLDGYETEFVVDRQVYAVHVPDELESVGVLTEPLSIAEKAIDEAVRIQDVRLPDAPPIPVWLHEKRCLVAGLGPVGLLAAMALILRGAEVYGTDIVDHGTARPLWLEFMGGKYLDGRKIAPDRVEQELGPMDFIFEATGVASLEFNLLDALGVNGVYVLTGIPGGDRPLQVQGAELMRRLVLRNQVMLGSVNASRDHFKMAVADLSGAKNHWGDHVEKLITHRYRPEEYEKALRYHGPDEIKSVIEWSL